MWKLLLAAAVAVAVFVGWQWHHAHTVQRDRDANIIYNRFWLDHIPMNERDKFNVFIAHTPQGIGGFAEETQWRGQIERFRFQPAPGEIRAEFPWTGDHETIKVEAKKCDADGFDFCLELTGSTRGVKKYYSRKEWRPLPDEDIDAFRSRVLGP